MPVDLYRLKQIAPNYFLLAMQNDGKTGAYINLILYKLFRIVVPFIKT